jgi:hypothetical protein
MVAKAAVKWLVKRWEQFFFALDEMDSDVEIKALCEAEIETWKKEHSNISERSFAQYMTETHHEIERRIGDEHKRAVVLRYMAFPREWYIKTSQGSQEAHEDRMENCQIITQPDAIVERATELLHSNVWPQVVVALAVVTGRRLTEVLKTAEFSHKTEYSVMFKGQLKHEGREIEAEFEIPTLVPASLVLNALVWLREHIDTTELEKDAVSRRHRTAVKAAANRDFVALVPPKFGKDDLYGHLMRSVYAALAVWYYCPLRVAELHYKSLVLGHEKIMDAVGMDEVARRNYQSTSHYADCKVVDDDGAMRQGVWLNKSGVELLEVLKPKEHKEVTEATQTQEVTAQVEPKRKGKNYPITVVEPVFDAVKALRQQKGHPDYSETVRMLLAAYNGATPLDVSELTPEKIAPHLAPVIREGMAAARENDFHAFLYQALEKEAKFQTAMAGRYGSQDFSQMPYDKLEGIKHPDAAKERVARAVKAIAAYNDQAIASERMFINQTSVHKIMRGRFGIIGEYLDEREQEIAAMNAKHNVTAAYNRKPDEVWVGIVEKVKSFL